MVVYRNEEGELLVDDAAEATVAEAGVPPGVVVGLPGGGGATQYATPQRVNRPNLRSAPPADTHYVCAVCRRAIGVESFDLHFENCAAAAVGIFYDPTRPAVIKHDSELCGCVFCATEKAFGERRR